MGIKKFFITGVLAAAVLAGGTSAFASENTYNSGSIVDHLISVGEDYSFAHRAELAQANNISGYRGTADQNVQLLNILQGGSAAAVAAAPAATEAKPEPKQEAKAASAPVTEVTDRQGTTLTVEATAYTAYCVGCSGITATGIDLRSNPDQKVIAVDPNVIPLGSQVHVEGYGTAIAGDTGGAIKGNRIDLFIPSQSEAISFGRQTLKITVLN